MDVIAPAQRLDVFTHNLIEREQTTWGSSWYAGNEHPHNKADNHLAVDDHGLMTSNIAFGLLYRSTFFACGLTEGVTQVLVNPLGGRRPTGLKRFACKPQFKRILKLEVSLNQFPELFPIFILHVYEFHAVALRPDIPHHRREVNLAKACANLQLDRIAHRQFPR